MTFLIMGLCVVLSSLKLEVILSSLINVKIDISCDVEWLVSG